jgi:hypothetical protein
MATVLLGMTIVLAEDPSSTAPSATPSVCSTSVSGNVTPLGTTNCGSYTCANDGQCCGSNTCCPSNAQFLCRNLNRCYSSESAARQACGNSYYICNKPAR